MQPSWEVENGRDVARRRFLNRWRDVAFLCRFGHQDVYRILGRDPFASPLTSLERGVFVRCVQEHWEAEIKLREGMAPDVATDRPLG